MDVVDTDPAEAILAKLAALDFSLAQQLHACAMNADDPTEMVNLARAYQRIARSTRQSLALHARMKRERERAEREAAQAPGPPPGPPAPRPAPPRDARRIAERRDAVDAAVRRVLWSEYEACDADEALTDLEMVLDVVRDRLAVASRNDTFGLVEDGDGWTVEPLDDHVARLCAELQLPRDVVRAWRGLPDPPPGALPSPDDDEPASPDG